MVTNLFIFLQALNTPFYGLLSLTLYYKKYKAIRYNTKQDTLTKDTYSEAIYH
ncbi:MAG: hypothetical protein ACJASB_001807 [Shewanella psychromarinicola]|jgi:hypothetical protein